MPKPRSTKRTLLRVLCDETGTDQQTIAQRLGLSCPLVSYWARSDRATGARLGAILPTLNKAVTDKRICELVREFLK